VSTAGDVMPNNQPLTEYRFRLELIAAMRAAFRSASG
jgi:hypothetical protein